MKIIVIVFLMFPIIMGKPLYGDKQIYSLLKNQYEKVIDFPEVLGIHIFNDKRGRVLQIDIEVQSNKNKNMIMAMQVMSQIGQYSKKPFHKFIVIEHYIKQNAPEGYESDAECAINYFVKEKIKESGWMKNCLSNSIIQRKIDNWSILNKDNKQ
tara:strand:- start:82 stop:543 length:462 start_codon:yes stop_codon:yes gene_type:complete